FSGPFRGRRSSPTGFLWRVSGPNHALPGNPVSTQGSRPRSTSAMSQPDTLDAPEGAPEGLLDRRRESRWELRGGVEAVCWKGPSGRGADVALAQIDVSVDGARLLVREDLAV